MKHNASFSKYNVENDAASALVLIMQGDWVGWGCQVGRSVRSGRSAQSGRLDRSIESDGLYVQYCRNMMHKLDQITLFTTKWYLYLRLATKTSIKFSKYNDLVVIIFRKEEYVKKNLEI